MSKMMRGLLGFVVAMGFVGAFWVITPNMPHVLAQSTTTGEWKASINKDNSKINLSLERRSDRGGHSQMGQTYEFSDFQGLNRETAVNGGPVKFSLVREAGRIDFEGNFENGKGSGTFNFTGNPSFVSAMKSRGFDFEERSNGRRDNDEDRLFAATTLNVTTALADDLNSLGFGKLNVDDLFKAAIFKIDSTFAREMKASGFENLGMEELVKARIFKIDAGFVRQVAQMGFEKEPFESLVKMQIFKVTPEFISEVRNEGLTDLQVEELVKLRIFKIDGQYIREAKADGVPLEVERLVQRKIGVSRR
ncbi:MAG TPA: hypothetical protein VFO99_12810 [Pyrinomonadaceae bacterium]|nr:hypothetical protein [Pyrinomonadaceae bacterium]